MLTRENPVPPERTNSYLARKRAETTLERWERACFVLCAGRVSILKHDAMVLSLESRKVNQDVWNGALESRAVWMAACWAVCFIFLVVRTPYSFFEPIFFAEDGLNYFGDIVNRGFMAALAQTHNGYFVFGNILLSGVAILVDRIFFGGDVRQVPLAIALVSAMT